MKEHVPLLPISSQKSVQKFTLISRRSLADMGIPDFVLSLLHIVHIFIPVAFSWLESQTTKCYERACASPSNFLTKVSAEVHTDFQKT
jgi:hypothetical protein